MMVRSQTAPVNIVKQVVVDPQTCHSALVQELAHLSGGKVTIIGSPMKFLKTPVARASTPPAIGQHTAEILAGALNYAAARTARFD